MIFWSRHSAADIDIKKGHRILDVRRGSGGRTRTSGLRVMSPTSYQLLYPAMLLDYKCRHYFLICKIFEELFKIFCVRIDGAYHDKVHFGGY